MKKYFSYFKILFIIMGLLFVGVIITSATHKDEAYVRKNNQAPDQRVFDYADVLSDSEEEKLEELISDKEGRIGCDIVVVTINESLYEKYGITEDTNENWERCVALYAEAFYDDNQFGFNIAGVNGDGVLLLHNWYPAEKGSHLAHGGKVWDHYDDYRVGEVLDEVYYRSMSSPYDAYKYYIEDVYKEMSGGIKSINPIIGLIAAVVSCVIFVKKNLNPKEGVRTTTENTYVENNSVKYNIKRDEFIRQYVTSRTIPQSSGGRGGRGGRSSGGIRMGGGSRRG